MLPRRIRRDQHARTMALQLGLQAYSFFGGKVNPTINGSPAPPHRFQSSVTFRPRHIVTGGQLRTKVSSRRHVKVAGNEFVVAR